MGGLDWSALESVAEMLGVKEPDLLILQLSMIRDHKAKKEEG